MLESWSGSGDSVSCRAHEFELLGSCISTSTADIGRKWSGLVDYCAQDEELETLPSSRLFGAKILFGSCLDWSGLQVRVNTT